MPMRKSPIKTIIRTILLILVSTASGTAANPLIPSKNDAPWPIAAKIFEAKCVRCHGRDSRKADLDLSSEEAAIRGGESSDNTDPTDWLNDVLLPFVAEGTMPPEGKGELTPVETQHIRRWINNATSRAESIGSPPNQHDVLPILLLRCAACHGKNEQKAGLDIRAKQTLLKGGKSGPAIVPGQPEQSLLLKRIHAEEMPPRRELINAAVKPMTPNEIEIVTTWIRNGAPEIEVAPDVMTTEPDPLVDDTDRDFWAFRAPESPPLPQNRFTPESSAIDSFLLTRMSASGLSFSREAKRETLIRRATFDLHGLPPTPEEIDRFLADRSAGAFSKLVDRLLASPRYGERWAQYWLDLAGYSDSEGVQHADPVRSQAWRYRDYVIRSLNSDKPYDRFLHEQIAGDELADYEHGDQITQQLEDNLVATGFLRMAPDGTFASLTGFVPDRLELIDDELEILSSTVMGLTIKCARCHSHKFDPIPQRDYYRLAAIFKGAFDEHAWRKPKQRRLYHVTADTLKAWQNSGGKDDNKPYIRALWDDGSPSPTYILRRGDYLTPGKLVGPGVPSVLTDGKTPFVVQPPWEGSTKTGRRLAFAKWLTEPDHPLTARVMVNRLWKHHFGQGIVRSLDNFGRSGELPTHPELLDWLAVRFVREGWSIKSMHRLMMNTAAYRQSSTITPVHLERDPQNQFVSRMPVQRLDAEAVRDAILHVASRLDFTPFGPPDDVVARADGLVSSAPYNNTSKYRRSIYVLKRRTQPVSLLQVFDRMAMDPNCVARPESIVAPQALHLRNNRWSYQMAGHLSDRILRESGDNVSQQIRYAWRVINGRVPDEEEVRIAKDSLQRLTEARAKEHDGTTHRITASAHLWIRESEPSRVFEDDLISVWSSKSTDSSRRFGLVEFNIEELRNLDLTSARLELGIQESQPINQIASVIPAGIRNYNWDKYVNHKSEHEVSLEALGHIATHPRTENIGRYALSEPATAGDLAVIGQQASRSGRIALVLKAREDGKAYRQDWDDGAHNSTHQLPPVLVAVDSRPNQDAVFRRAFHDFCHGLLNSASFLFVD